MRWINSFKDYKVLSVCGGFNSGKCNGSEDAYCYSAYCA